jgi:hypothetical protein
MNLTSIFRKDAAIVDHAWMRDGIVHPGEPQLDISKVRNPNNIKPQLELEWGSGGPNIDLEEPAGKVKRNLPESAQADAGPVVLFARDLMNQGMSSAKVAEALRKRYGKTVLAAAKAGLTELFKLDGVIGRVAVDGRGYRSCKDALKAASRSPYKRFIRYVWGCECGEPHMMPPGGSEGLQMGDTTGNPMDDFLASDVSGGRRDKVAHCRSTMLPLLGSMGDLDKSELDGTLVEMMNVTSLPQGFRTEVAKMKGSNLGKLAAAFRLLDRTAEAEEKSRYVGKVSSAEHRLVRGDTEVEFDGIAMPDIEVDGLEELSGIGRMELDEPVAPRLDVDGDMEMMDEVEAEGPAEMVMDEAMPPEFGVDLSGVSAPQIPVELMDGDSPTVMRLYDEEEPAGMLPIDPATAPMTMPEFGMSEMGDLDMVPCAEPEFAGGDVVDLDERVEPDGAIDVEMLMRPDDEDEFLASDGKK